MSKKEFARNEGIPFSSFRGFLKNKDQLLQDMGRRDSIFRKEKRRCRNNPESSEESEDEGSNINLIHALKVVRKYAQKSNMANEVEY